MDHSREVEKDESGKISRNQLRRTMFHTKEPSLYLTKGSYWGVLHNGTIILRYIQKKIPCSKHYDSWAGSRLKKRLERGVLIGYW